MSERRPVKQHDKTTRPVVAHNTLLDGMSGEEECPCFILDTVGMAPTALRAECEVVYALQSIAPVFKVVLFSDLPVFDITRRCGWPLEHFPSLAHRERNAHSSSVSGYLSARRSLLSDSYHRAIVIPHSPTRSLAAGIADATGVADLLETACGLAGCSEATEPPTGSWESVFGQLESQGRAVLASDGGEALLELPRTGDGHLFVRGSVRRAGEARVIPDITAPETATICTIVFAPGSSLEFESAAYTAIARRYGSRHSVVLPWRTDAALLEDSMRTLDLAIEVVGGQPMVLREYGQRYVLMVGSREFTWRDGLVYGAARRLARSIAAHR
ncbi:hypothetical protein M3G50_01075 [Brachybacterium muris]|uniref:hypothetical protein n=1 Tax=Brachybacterium muris TaxID=219301 RepID=UPI0021A5FCA2|nr:hypothetical protein [Brachybacterium muris]MCT1429361.1 hypothetical protein [Brachybacterium muris]